MVGIACTKYELIEKEGFKKWDLIKESKNLNPDESVIVVCDVWDKHWCFGANFRLGKLLPHMNKFLNAARDLGFLIIHAPSDCMPFYKDLPSRKKLEGYNHSRKDFKLLTQRALNRKYPPLPLSTPHGGSDTPSKDQYRPNKRVWNRQHEEIDIDEQKDLISDNGLEIATYLRDHNIKNYIICGVHTNMCILHRSFGLKQMRLWGFDCFIVSDLTDTMYSPVHSPYVSHKEGTKLIINYIEKFIGSSFKSQDFIK